jgi:SAM-dependent methyltransferase
MNLHDAARRGFGRDPDAYERGRPEYPQAAVRWLVAQLGLGPGRLVIDVGAGTGKLTRALFPSGAGIVAIEPVAAMREVLARRAPAARVHDGTAEAMPVREGTADAIVSGQAFHWFDGPAALAEFHRVLRPGGRLGLIWNRRAMEQPLQRAIDEIIEPLRGAAPSHRSGRWRRAFEDSSLFRPIAERAVRFEQELDEDAFVDRIGSTSFVAALDDPRREQVLARVRALARERLEPLAHASEVFVFERVE